MSFASQKRIAAKILKCGVSRVKIQSVKEVEEALTRQDIRNLIRRGIIKKIQKKGTSKFYSRKRMMQKKKGRRRGIGSRKGSPRTKNPKKKSWIKAVRTLRKFLKELKASGRIDSKTYTKTYLQIKGGSFRSKKHLMLYLKEHELLKEAAKKEKKPARTKKPKGVKNGKK